MRIEVDTRIPYGNACDLSLDILGDIVEVGFSPDPHWGPETLWFCFRLCCSGAPEPALNESPAPDCQALAGVRLVLKHSANMLGGNEPSAMRPVVRYDDSEWRRLPKGDLERLPDGRVTISWSVGTPEHTLDVAYCYPYGLGEVRALVTETDDAWAVDTIGVSQAARPLLRLSNGYGTDGGQRPGLYLMARQHSGETPGSWVLDGFLRAMATFGVNAPLVWAIPLANIDGIEQGDYGKDNFPYDLNRAWGRPPMRHEVLVFQRDLWRWRARCRPVLAIDFHAPGACEANGVYAYVPDPDTDRGAHEVVLQWADWTGEALGTPYAAREFARVARYPSRWETPSFRSYLWSQLGVPCITFETPYTLVGDNVLTQEDYREIGRRIANGVMQGLHALGLDGEVTYE
ncbi:MAG: hypothetical protein MUF84_00910 [Anaerolineae bacterium]|nr:hypothetical protein [Anaerolineae bacterium]